MTAVMAGLAVVVLLGVFWLVGRVWRPRDMRRWLHARDVMAGWADDPWADTQRNGCEIIEPPGATRRRPATPPAPTVPTPRPAPDSALPPAPPERRTSRGRRAG